MPQRGEEVCKDGVDRMRPVSGHVPSQAVVGELLVVVQERFGPCVIGAELEVLAHLLVHLNLKRIVIRLADAGVSGNLCHSLVSHKGADQVRGVEGAARAGGIHKGFVGAS